ncbi:hypothetical protein roselon_00387 [Roseibacterium elongatum DSM 19469]|uniref:Uncharacterized protein n=1 Tax=Roseicyclus elongatus DSM 19469 TaxID=1294273 RepID=W8RYA9_9RHOB|nr:hypothetical protein [Roseibacterium elongatum]AHM02832.1 hypothetical protein roselon_00387 [Roseibacterium elongatum DSM 19469]
MTRRAILVAIAGLLALAIGVAGLLGRGTWNPAIHPAEAAAEEIALSTATVYISLRAINAALSVAQDIELGASLGAQASLQPLKVLEPVDDTVERVASVVFTVAAGAALASVGLAPVASIGLILLGLGLLARVGRLLFPERADGLLPYGRQAERVGATLGLILPLVFALGVNLGEVVTQPQWQTAMADLRSMTEEANILIGAGASDVPDAADAGNPGAGVFQRLGDWVDGMGDGVGAAFESSQRYLAAAQVFLDEADDLFRASLTIIGIFALRMVVLPALLLWGALALMRRSVAG